MSLRVGRFGRRGALVLAGAAAGIALVGGVAWAYWSTTASVPTYGFADSVATGGQPTDTANGGSITVNWPASTTAAGRAVGGYLVNRYPGATGGSASAAAQGTCAAVPVTATTCTETNLPAGTWYYTVTPVLGAWRGTESPRGNGISTADTFALSVPGGTLTAGTASTLTITAKAGGQTDVGYGGTRTLAFGGPGAAPNGTAPSYNGGSSSVAFTNGVATVPVTLYKAESPTLTVADGTVTGSAPLTVSPGAASQFALSAVSSVAAGTQQSITLTALDAYRNTATGYAGGKTLTWSGPGTAPDGTHAPSYPANPVTFTGGVAAGLPVTFYRAESPTLTAAAGAVTGTSGTFTVSPATAAQLSAPTPATQAAGTAFTVTLTALDAYRNTATGYVGGKTLTWSGPGTAPDGTHTPTYPTNPVTFAAGTATATITLVRAESPTLRASDGTIGWVSGAFTVNPGAAARLAWTHVTIAKGSLSTPCLFTCTATGVGNGGTYTANVSVTDVDGNTVRNLGAGTTVTVTEAGGGSFTQPTAGTTVTLTIASSGPADSTGQFVFQGQNGTWTDTLTATAPSYTSASATVAK